MSDTDKERFWGKVVKSDGCWLWTGNKFQGYGQIRFAGKTRRAHRVAWELTRGSIPAGLYVCHHCDNPSCVNPGHLFLGTQTDNMRDCLAKGRFRAAGPRGAANGSATHPEMRPTGERNGRAVLTVKDVMEIRRRLAFRGPGAETVTDVAIEFGLTKSAVSKIITGRTWKSVTDSPQASLDI